MDNLKGMGWMTLSMLCFAITDSFIKLTFANLPIGQVLTVFSLGGVLFFGAWALLRGDRILDWALFTRSFLLRLVFEVVGTVCFLIALARIDLSLLSAIIQANPLLVTLGAALFLRQAVGWRRWLAISVGLVGVLIIVRPGMAGFEPASFWAVGAVIGLTGRDLATRAIPREVSTLLLSAWGFAAAAVAGLLILAVERNARVPDATVALQIGGGLLFVLVAYYAITAAMRVGDLAAVTPFRYTRLIFALVLSYSVFGERPDLWTYVGAGIVIATGLFTLFREQAALRTG